MSQIVYVVGRLHEDEEWELRGIFFDSPKAESLCERADDFVGPVEIDKVLPSEKGEWPGLYFPKE